MAYPVSERIVQAVRTRLLTIDGTGDFETEVESVNRPRRISTFSPKDYQIVVTQGNMTHNVELSHPGNPPAQAWDLPIIIAGILRPSESNTTAIDTLKNTFGADCILALTDATAWHTFGGLAINSMISDVEDYQADDGSASGFKMTVLVTFRVDENNPYTVRG